MRQEDVRRRPNLHTEELRRCDADDGERHRREPDRSADDRRIPREPPFPVAIAEHRDRMPVRHTVVVGSDRPPDRRIHAQQREIVAGHELTLDGRLRRPVDAHIDGSGRVARHARHGIVIPYEAVLTVGEPGLDGAALLPPGHEQALGVLHRQHPPHHRVHQGEDRGVGADPQAERQDHCRREARALAQHPQGVHNVASDRFDEPLTAGLASLFRHRSNPPRDSLENAHTPEAGPASRSRCARSREMPTRRLGRASGPVSWRPRRKRRGPYRERSERPYRAERSQARPLPRGAKSGAAPVNQSPTRTRTLPLTAPPLESVPSTMTTSVPPGGTPHPNCTNTACVRDAPAAIRGSSSVMEPGMGIGDELGIGIDGEVGRGTGMESGMDPIRAVEIGVTVGTEKPPLRSVKLKSSRRSKKLSRPLPTVMTSRKPNGGPAGQNERGRNSGFTVIGSAVSSADLFAAGAVGLAGAWFPQAVMTAIAGTIKIAMYLGERCVHVTPRRAIYSNGAGAQRWPSDPVPRQKRRGVTVAATPRRDRRARRGG